MRKIIVSMFLLFIFYSVNIAQDANGLIKVESKHSVEETASKMKNLIKEKGLTFFTKINHRKNAETAGLEMKPTVVLIFGNPKLGTPIMKCEKTYAIDLPQKMLIYEDDEGKVWIVYNDQDYLVKRHKLKECKNEIEKVKNALKSLAEGAARD